MQLQDNHAHALGLSPASEGAGGDSAAVSELIADIEAELRLHQVRVHEFLDGTPEFPSVTVPAERARLIRTSEALASVLSDLGALG